MISLGVLRRGWDITVRDAGYAARALHRDKAFAIFALSILALGIGATTAVFSIAQALVLRPLPFPESVV